MPDLAALFRFTVPPAEILIRGTAIYWFLFLLFRVVLRRDVGAVGIADVLLLVLIADASQNALSGGYESITDGMVLVLTIAGWNYALDWAAFHFPAVRRLIEGKPLVIVRRGQMLRGNMRHELLTVNELMSKLRQQGIADLAEVREARMESDGQISVIKEDSSGDGPPPKGRQRVA